MSSTGVENAPMDVDIGGKQSHESGEENLREKFVAYIHALSGSAEGNSEVWVEHSYARSNRSRGSRTMRSLLVPPSPPRCDDDFVLDVVGVEDRPAPPVSPGKLMPFELALSEEDTKEMDDANQESEDWEEKLESLAPTPAHRQLVTSVIEIIRSFRTARLTGDDGTWGCVQTHTRRLRRELTHLWNYSGPIQQRPPAWMHAVLSAYLPRPYLHLYNEMVSELAQCIPKLIGRLLAGQVAPAGPERALVAPRIFPAPDKPLLIWMPSGEDERDAVWENYLGQVMAVHRIPTPQVNECTPEAWCTAVAASCRSAVHALSGTGRSSTLVGGCGAGAALAIHTASNWEPSAGSAPEALILFSPPLLTAEGPREMTDDVMYQLKIPILFVVGQNAMQCSVNIAAETVERLGYGARLLVVGSADDTLTLSDFKLRTERVTHAMVYAAVAEEVHNFTIRALQKDYQHNEEQYRLDDSSSDRSVEQQLPLVAVRRRPSDKKYKMSTEVITPTVSSPPTPVTSAAVNVTPPTNQTSPGTRKGRGLALLRVSSSPIESLGAAQIQVVRAQTGWDESPVVEPKHTVKEPRNRNIQITENVITRGPITNGVTSKGYVVRGTGSTPLSLPPPRRAAPAPAPAPPQRLDTSDIMQLPIVFADDDQIDLTEVVPASTPAPPPTFTPATTQLRTVQIGSRKSPTPLKYTKVIVGKRAQPSSSTPILFKGGMKILPKGLVIKRKFSEPRKDDQS